MKSCLVILLSAACLAAKPVDRTKTEAAELHPEPVSENAIDLRTAIDRALAQNPALIQAREKVRQAGSDRNVTRAALLPTLNLTANGSRQKQPLGNLGKAPFNGEPYDMFTTDLKLTQPLIAFGAFSAVDVADFTTQSDRLDVEVSERTLTANVTQSFHKVLLEELLLQNFDKVQKVLNESLATAETRLRTGRGQLLDVLQVKTNIALLKPQIEDTRNQWEQAAAQLATYLSENGKYYLHVTGELKALRMKDVAPLVGDGDVRLPELIKLQVQLEQLEAQKRVTFGPHLPSLNLVADLGSQAFNTADFTSPHVRDWSVSLQLTIPIFSGLSSIHQRRSLASQGRQIDLGTHDLRNTLALNQINARKALETSEASLLSAEEAADLADQSLKEASRNYRLATIDFMQFLTVEQSDVTAYSTLYTNRYNNIVAFVNWFVASGHPLSKLVDLLSKGKA